MTIPKRAWPRVSAVIWPLIIPAVAACSDSRETGGSDASSDGRVAEASLPPLPDASSECQAAVAQGAMRGKAAGATCEYLGIPYAAPPVGPLRFAPPLAAAGWSGVRDATQPGPWCIQSPPASDGNTYSEDCLVLNVYAPKTAPSQPLPVMVFIHGGGFTGGSGNEYDAQALAEAGPVVVITLNYRLGVLGYLALRELDAQRSGVPSGTDGIRDQQLALRWVKANAGTFHGDPTNVTVFGESAGSVSTVIHLVSPGSVGLAHRYIMESGAALDPPGTTPSQAHGYAVGQLLATSFCGAPANSVLEDAGVDEGGAEAGADGALPDGALADASALDPVACLRAANPSALMAWAAPPSLEELTSSFLPIVDGPGGVLPDLPANLIAAGTYDKDAAILAGTNRREWGLLNQLSGAPTNLTSIAAFDQLLDMSLPSIAPQIKMLYPVLTDADAQDAYLSVLTDFFFRCPTRDLALATTSHGTKDFYLYSYEVGRAFHTDELLALFALEGPFFPTVVPPPTIPSAPFQSQMKDYWTRFAATGDPNLPGAPGPAWPTYDAATESRIVLTDPAPSVGMMPDDAACKFWSGRNYATTGP